MRLLSADTFALGLSFLVAYQFRTLLDRPLFRPAAPLHAYLWLLPVIIPLWIGLLAALSGYGIGWLSRSRAWLAIQASALGLLLLTGGLFLVQEYQVNRSLLVLFAAVSAVAVWAERTLVQAWLRRDRPSLRQALVVGTDHRAARLISAFRSYPETGWAVPGCVSLDPPERNGTVLGVPVIGALQDLADLLQGDGVIDEVLFAVPPGRLDELTEAFELCESLGVDARVMIDLHQPAQGRPFAEELFGLPFYSFSPTPGRQGSLATKRAIDVVGAFLLLIVTSPLWLLIALGLKLASPAPVLFRQERAGFHGRRIWMYKFRTMIPGAETMRDEVSHLNRTGGPIFKATRDPRVTRLGRFLRRWSLDELPQLWNVLKGEMSLVGPRPLPLYEARQIKGPHRRRLAMRPGITGLWQVSGRSMLRFEEWMSRDLEYVDRWSLARDLRILLLTIPAVIRGEGAY